MFFQIFRSRITMIIHDRAGLFWTAIFPILMATLFYLAFSNLTSGESFKKIDVAVTNTNSNPTFIEMLNETELFNVKKCDEPQAKKLLDEGKVSGIIHIDNELTLSVTQNGINQSILKNVLDSYQRVSSTLSSIIEKNPEVLKTNFMNDLNVNQTFVKEKPIGDNTNIVVIYFYSLIAMACLVGATHAVIDIELIQANQSPTAARLNVAPTHKLKAFVASISATILLHFASVLVSIAYINFVLKIDLMTNIGWIILLVAVGCFAGIMFGAMIGSFTQKSTNIKMVIIIVIVMVGCFLAGMMDVNMAYLIKTHAPIVAYVNPANLITDALYSLYYYGVNQRYFINFGILFVFGVVCCTVTYFKVRRQKYASI